MTTWVTLLRPRLVPFVLLLPVVGFGYAHWSVAAPLAADEAPRLGRVLVAWALLHAGTMWLNAARDQDRGEVLFGTAVPVPAAARRVGGLVLLGTIVLTTGLPLGAWGAGWACVVLAFGYSWPRGAWKGHPLGGPLVNVLGYGLLSPLAGWSCAGLEADPRTLVLWSLGALGILGVFFAAQAFQGDEDRARGDRTLVATRGPGFTLGAARVCFGGAFLGVASLIGVGWLPAALIFVLPVAWSVDAYLRTWARHGGGDEAWARGLAGRLSWGVWIGVLLVFADYAASSVAGGPVAGLATGR